MQCTTNSFRSIDEVQLCNAQLSNEYACEGFTELMGKYSHHGSGLCGTDQTIVLPSNHKCGDITICTEIR